MMSLRLNPRRKVVVGSGKSTELRQHPQDSYTLYNLDKLSKSGMSLGLVVTGEDSCLRGHEFTSQYRVLRGSLFTYIC